MNLEALLPAFCWSQWLRCDSSDMAEAITATHPQPAASPVRAAAAPSSGPPESQDKWCCNA